MLAYVGTRGSNLTTLLTSTAFGGGLNAVLNIGSSKYDSLQATAQRRGSNGLSYLASYTLGSAHNNTAGLFPRNASGFSASATDPSCVGTGTGCNLGVDYGPQDYDARHRFTLAATYALPFAGQNVIAGGWNVNTVFTYQTGTPFTVYANGKRADQNGNPNNGPKTID